MFIQRRVISMQRNDVSTSMARDVYTTSNHRRCNDMTLSQRFVPAEDKAKTLTRIRSWLGLSGPLLFAHAGMWHWSRLPVSKLVNKPHPSMPSGLFYLSPGTNSFPTERVSGWFLLSPGFIEILIFNANSVDPDQTLRSAASDLSLHCLPMSLLWD